MTRHPAAVFDLCRRADSTFLFFIFNCLFLGCPWDQKLPLPPVAFAGTAESQPLPPRICCEGKLRGGCSCVLPLYSRYRGLHSFVVFSVTNALDSLECVTDFPLFNYPGFQRLQTSPAVFNPTFVYIWIKDPLRISVATSYILIECPVFCCEKRRQKDFPLNDTASPPPQELLQLEDRLGSVNRGAIQSTIERFTFPHKYKKVSVKCVYLPVGEGCRLMSSGTQERHMLREKWQEGGVGVQEKGQDACRSSKVNLISLCRLMKPSCSIHTSGRGMTHPAVCRYERAMN